MVYVHSSPWFIIDYNNSNLYRIEMQFDDAPFDLIPTVKVTPSYIVTYNRCVWTDPSKRKSRTRLKQPYDSESEGVGKKNTMFDSMGQGRLFEQSSLEISKRSAAKIKKAISWLLFVANDKEVPSTWHGKTFKFKLSFITLTLSAKQVHSDSEVKKKCLNQFLVEARKKWKVVHYLWRAEAQQNGNIHFHILCDKFIPWSELRDVWNRIQNKLGYVDAYRDEMRAFHNGGFQVRRDLLKKWDYKNQLRAYRTGAKYDWNSPNSTDIHSVVRVKNLPAYLSKYCTKNQEHRHIEGNVWNLSESLSKLDGAVGVIDGALFDELSELVSCEGIRVFDKPYYSIICVDVKYLFSKNFSVLPSLVIDYVSSMCNQLE